MNRFKKLICIVAALLVLVPVSFIGISHLYDSLTPGAIEAWQEGKLSLGEIFDPSGNPFAHRFSDMKDIRGATVVIAASDSEHRYDCDIRCDGTSDEVQINTLATAGYKIQLLEGTFTNGAPITAAVNNLALEGQGDGTLITLANASNCNVITIGGDGWQLKDFKIDGNEANQTGGHGIYADAKDRLYAENVHITECEDCGIYYKGNDSRFVSIEVDNCDAAIGDGFAAFMLSTCNHVTVTNSLVHDNGAGGAFLAYNCNYVTYTNCVAETNGYSHFHAEGDAVANCTNIVFNGCVSLGNTDGSGIRFLKASHCAATGCSVYNCANDAFLLSEAEHITCTGNTIETAATNAFNIGGSKYVTIGDNVGVGLSNCGVMSGIAATNQIIIVGNYFSSAWQTIYATDTGDDWIIDGNWLEYTGWAGCIELENADDVIISNNRIHATNGFAVTLDSAFRVRFLIMGNNWEGCAADLTIGASVTTICIDNINKDGNPYLVDQNFVLVKTWVKHDAQNPAVCTVPAGSFVRIAGVFTNEVWNADGTDLLTVGYDAVVDSLLTSYDLAAGGLGWQDISANAGVEYGYMATERAIELYYTSSDLTNLTTGETLVVLEVTRCPAP